MRRRNGMSFLEMWRITLLPGSSARMTGINGPRKYNAGTGPVGVLFSFSQDRQEYRQSVGDGAGPSYPVIFPVDGKLPVKNIVVAHGCRHKGEGDVLCGVLDRQLARHAVMPAAIGC